MKLLVTLTILFATTISSAAVGNFKIVCGDDSLRIGVLAHQKDLLSSIQIKGLVVNGKALAYKSAFVSNNDFFINQFGYKGYENLIVYLKSPTCDDGKSLVATALYSRYNAKYPTSPIDRLVLKCVCINVW